MKLEFMKNISHEIRTPLNVVSGFTQILTAEGIDVSESDKKEYRERITENTDRITRMVERLLLLSDLHSDTLIGSDDQTSVHEIVAQAIEFSEIAKHTRPVNEDSSVVFENHEPDTQIPVRTNIRHAFRSLAQLFENAMKFTKEGSIKLFVEDSDTMVRFIVEDTGIGVPAKEAEHIFDEFVQLDTFADGAGVGLTVCRSINRRMGGDVWLDTNYSHGARFVLEIKKG
jgi:signal transduction histidine kinase